MLRQLHSLLRNELNKLKWRKKNVRFLKNSKISSDCDLEGFNSLGENAVLNNCKLGIGTYIGKNTELTRVTIGRFCSIGSFIRNTTGRHPVSNFVSTHPAFFSKGKAAGFTFSSHQKFKELHFTLSSNLVEIGNDVWIGDNVIIADGVTIGDGAVIGANSLVNKDIEPYSINVGSPTRILRYRFEKEIIDKLALIKWWEKDFDWIKANFNLFEDIALFLEKVDI